MSTLRYLSSTVSQEIDLRLMSVEFGFGLEQLMELAGLSCAQAIHHVYSKQKFNKPLICCGPGNNGGDGLVLTRHLVHFGYNPTIFYPKQNQSPLFKNLVQQNKTLQVPFLEDISLESIQHFDIIVDAFFGFSFKGDVRPPFDKAMDVLKSTKIPIISVDIPSGWNVDEGDTKGDGIKPEMLISLTAPKLCASFFHGKYHFLGGRFVPKILEDELQLHLPKYPGSDQFVDISSNSASL